MEGEGEVMGDGDGNTHGNKGGLQAEGDEREQEERSADKCWWIGFEEGVLLVLMLIYCTKNGESVLPKVTVVLTATRSFSLTQGCLARDFRSMRSVPHPPWQHSPTLTSCLASRVALRSLAMLRKLSAFNLVHVDKRHLSYNLLLLFL